MEIVWIALILFVLGLLGGYGWMLKTSIQSHATEHLGRQMWVATVVLLPFLGGVIGLIWALCCMEPSAAQWRASFLLGWVVLLLLAARRIVFGGSGASPDGSAEIAMLAITVAVGAVGEVILFIFL